MTSSPMRSAATIVLFAVTTVACVDRAVTAPVNTGSGTLTVGDQAVELSHVLFEESYQSMMLVLMSEPRDLDWAFAIGSNSVILSLDLENGKLATSVPSYIQHESFRHNNGTILNPEEFPLELELDSFTETTAVGRASMAPTELSNGDEASLDVEFDVTFVKVDPCTDLEPVVFTGDSSKPAKAVRELFLALTTCDWKGATSALTGRALENWKPIPDDERAIGLFKELFLPEMPRQVEISAVAMQGDERATVTVQFGDTEPVEMAVERVGRKWKVSESETIRMNL